MPSFITLYSQLFFFYVPYLDTVMDVAMTCLAWMSSTVLHRVVSHFLAIPVEGKGYSAEQEDSLRPWFYGNLKKNVFNVMGQETCE